MHVSRSINEDGSIELYFTGISHWDDFDLILGLLQQENNCQILSNKEMIYIRKAVLLWKNINFDLIQDDMLGNYIFTKKAEDVPDLEELAMNVIKSIKDRISKHSS